MDTAISIIVQKHRDQVQCWYSAMALVGHNMLGEGIWRTIVTHTPNRRVIAREMRSRWGVLVPLRQVRWVCKTQDSNKASGDPDYWRIATTLLLCCEVR